MIQKINIGTTLAALALFFLPWTDIRCSDKSLFTQTGVQTIYGGGSPSADSKPPVGEEQSRKKVDGRKDNDSMGVSPLVAIAMTVVLGAVVLAFVALRSPCIQRNDVVGMLCAAALVMLTIQILIGFPVKRKLGESVSKGSVEQSHGEDPFADADLASEMIKNFQVHYLPALYFELLMLGIPTLILANGLIDRMRKS